MYMYVYTQMHTRTHVGKYIGQLHKDVSTHMGICIQMYTYIKVCARNMYTGAT